jgi:excisionase family DNA binding protein
MRGTFWSIRQVAEFLNVSASSIRLWIRQGRFRCTRAGRRVLIDRKCLEQRAASGQLLEPVQRDKPESQREKRDPKHNPGQLSLPFARDANFGNCMTSSNRSKISKLDEDSKRGRS